MEFPISTAKRVSTNTSAHVNEQIEHRTHAAVQDAYAGDQVTIDKRLAQLDREWDIERCLETGASSLTVLGILLGKTVDRRWYLLPAAVGGFLLQHALQGWCPPLPVFRRLGIRTADEINRERYALKALRGDFAQIDQLSGTEAIEESLRKTKH